MLFKLTDISVILFVTTLINSFTTAISWRRRKTKGGVYMALGMTGITVWTLAAGFDYAAVPIPLKVFFSILEYTGYNIALSLLAIFSLFYAGYESLWKNKWTKIFFALPLISILLAWTNHLHGWLWSGFTRSKIGDNSVIFEHGPGFVWAVIIGYLMVAIIVVNLWRASRQGSELARRQARLLLFATFIPVLSNLVYLFHDQTASGIDWSSITFSISGVFFVLALYGTRFLDIIPIARRTTFEWMKDCVLVLDTSDQLIDFNHSAREVFNFDVKHLGSPIQVAMRYWPDIVEFASADPGTKVKVTTINQEKARVFDMHLSALEDEHKQVYGKLLVLRDITEQHQNKQALDERVKELKSIYDLSMLVEKPGISLEEILQESVHLIAAAMQFPELAWARLRIGEQSYSTINYQEHAPKIAHDIVSAGHKIGTLEAGYLSSAESESSLSFLKEEETLLEIMVERLGKIIQRLRLEAERTLMSETLDVLPVGVCLTDEGGYYQVMNVAYCKIYEYDRKEMLGQHYSVIMPPDQVSLANTHYARLLSGDVGIPVERKRQRKDGSVVYIEAANAMVENADGKKMVITTVRDITEKYWGDKALRENENLMRTIAENYPNSYLLIIEKDFTVGFASGNEYKKQNLEPGQLISVQLEAIFEDQATVIEEYCEKTFTGKEQEFELYVKEEHQLFRTVPLFKEDGSIPHILIVVENMTDRRQAERLNRFRLELWEYSVSHSINDLVRKALDEVCTLISSPIGFYHFVEEDQETHSLQAWSTRAMEGIFQAEGKRLHYDFDQAGVWADAFRQQEPVIQNDSAALPHHHNEMPEEYAELKRQLMVPVLRNNKVVSILGIGDKPSDYNQNDIDLVSAIADLMWTIVNYKQTEEKIRQTQVQLAEQQSELYKTEERQRLARDLHDSVNQSIHSMVMFSDTLAATLEKKNFERADHIIGRLQESARQSLKETRLLLYELQTEGSGRSMDIVQELEERLAMVERRAGLRTQFTHEGSFKYYPPEWSENLFWIAIEALNNSLKHAQARSVQIMLRCLPEYVELEVHDDGIGFEPGKVRLGGMGLANLRARADIIGGKLTVESEPGKGTSIQFHAVAKVTALFEDEEETR